MTHRRPPLLAALLLCVSLGAACNERPIFVTVLGDSHSDIDRVPRYDWVYFKPANFVVNEQATRSWSCRQIVLEALAEPVAGTGDVMVVFCGTNDAGRSWNLDETLGWIRAAIDHGLSQGSEVVVVTPPPAFTDATVPAWIRNIRLFELRAAIFGLQTEFDIEIADGWQAILDLPDFELYYAEDGLHLDAGRAIMAREIARAVRRAL